MVDHIQIQSGLVAIILCRLAAHQLVLSAGHNHKAGVGTGQHRVQVLHLHIGLQGDLFFTGQVAGGSICQGFYPAVAVLRRLQFGRCVPHLIQNRLIGMEPHSQCLALIGQRMQPGLQLRQLGAQCRRVRCRASLQLLSGLLQSGYQGRRLHVQLCHSSLRLLVCLL